MKFDITRVDVIDFLEALEVENVTEATEQEVKFSCPFSGHQHGDQNPSAYMNKENTAWYCHGCKRKGNAVSFLAEIGTITIMESVRFLKERYGGAMADPDSVSMRSELERFYEKRHRKPEMIFDVQLDDDVNSMFAIDWDRAAEAQRDELPGPLVYMLHERQFSGETLTEWEIGHDEISDRVTIPVRDENGRLMGFKARSWDGRKPKYLVLGGDKYGWPRYHKSRVVFGLNKVLEFEHAVWEREPFAGIVELIICEGELNVMALWQIGIENAVAVSGSDFSSTQARLIRSFADSAVVFFDSDQQGFDGTATVVEALKDFMPVKVVPDHEGDPASMDAESVRGVLQDAQSVTRIQLAARS